MFQKAMSSNSFVYRFIVVFLGIFILAAFGCSSSSDDDSGGSDYSFTYAYLQYRTYSVSVDQPYRSWLEFFKDGEYARESDITQIVLKDSSGDTVAIDTPSFYSGGPSVYGRWDEGSSSLVFSDSSSYTGYGVKVATGTILSAGNYTYEATAADGSVLTKTIYFPGDTIMPVVTGLSSEFQADGSLELSWSLPNGSWDSLRVVLYDESGDDFITIRPQSDATEAVIPSATLVYANTLNTPTTVYWQVQTRNDNDNNNYARGYSDEASIDWSSIY